MQTENAFGILTIRGDNSGAHLYPDTPRLLAGTAPGTGENSGAVEFFSTAGHRLAPVFGPRWQLVDLVRTSEEPQPELVLRRLRTTVRNMRAYLLDNRELVEKAGLTVEEGLALLPSLREVSLDMALQTWSKLLAHPAPTHSISPWHDFWVHGIF
jgi:hypothetical protein